MFKNLFGGGSRPSEDSGDHSLEDLIVLERYPEAEARLRARLKAQPDDLHAHLKLGEVHAAMGQYPRAVDCYLHVADEYARDGFYDRAIALLGPARKFAPLDSNLADKQESYRLAKAMEASRRLAIEGLKAGSAGTTAALIVERLWHHLAPSPLARNLPPEELRRLFRAMTLEKYDEGTVLAEAGGENERLFFLVEGVVRAGLPGRGKAEAIRDFGAGDVLGERALLKRSPWPATYTVVEPARALVLNRGGLEQALVGNPDPRGFLTALRMQHNDKDVIKFLERLGIEAP